MSQDNLPGTLGVAPRNVEDLIDNAEQSVECRLDRVPAVDGHVAMQNLLQNFGIGDQALAVIHQLFEPSLGVTLVRVRRSHKIHGDVGIDQNHGCAPDPYPISISSSIRRMSPVGRSNRAAARMTSSFLPTLSTGSRRCARSSACRTHSAIDIWRERAARLISRYSGSFMM